MGDGGSYLDSIRSELQAGRKQWKRGDKILEAFGYRRRRQSAVDLINRGLEDRGISTIPVLTTSMPLDRTIRFRLVGEATEMDAEAEPSADDYQRAGDTDGGNGAEQDSRGRTAGIADEPPVADPANPADRQLIIGNLECAERIPEQISPNASLKEALTKMDLLDYSQLVVTSGPRDIRGIISYESIARASLQGSAVTVQDCIDTTIPRVERGESLLSVVERFEEHAAVLVIGHDKTLAGIVTPADIAKEFVAMTGSFLLAGQIEEQLRWLVAQRLDLRAARDACHVGPEDMPGDAAVDLTMGGLQRILENPGNWTKVGIQYDRATFCKEMDAVRNIRNAVMHFRENPDAAQFMRLKRFAAVVQRAYLALAG